MNLRLTAVVCTFAAISTSFGVMAAQQGPPPGGPGFHHFGPFGAGPHGIVTNAPYSATFTDTHTGNLQDGTPDNRTTTRVAARDSQGRTREDVTFTGKDNQPHTESTLFDPIARTITRWDSTKKEAHLFQLPEPRQHEVRSSDEAAPAPRPERPGFTTTDLGSKTIDGVSVNGRRETHTFPVNGKEEVSTHERWYSSDLKIVLSESDSDPFRGSNTLTVSNLNRAEPAATLFQVPSGYTVVQEQPHRGHRGPQGPPPAGLN